MAEASEKNSYSVHDATRLPGLISMLRLPLAAAFPFFVHKPALAIAILVAAALTDILDGQVARRRHQVTATGAILDGIMDKIFVLTVVVTLVASASLTVLEAALLGTRDIAELPLALYVAQKRGFRRGYSANPFGKLATVLQFLTLCNVVIGTAHHGLWVLATSSCGAVAAASYWAREARAKNHMSGAH
jgi:phosphatidylglycerophosphate synthase